MCLLMKYTDSSYERDQPLKADVAETECTESEDGEKAPPVYTSCKADVVSTEPFQV